MCPSIAMVNLLGGLSSLGMERFKKSKKFQLAWTKPGAKRASKLLEGVTKAALMQHLLYSTPETDPRRTFEDIADAEEDDSEFVPKKDESDEDDSDDSDSEPMDEDSDSESCSTGSTKSE
mmetsp:Transcript_23660/g.33898  ORF Transcript_23660/g.33898 Transcript_23660/m.33898 type:complete len:120 (-) Transcript_23660:89-448(-)